MSESIAMADVDLLKSFVKGHSLTHFDGHYLVCVGQQQFHDIKVMQAREQWRDYYRCVRILRRIHSENSRRFWQFNRLASSVWVNQ